MTGRLTELVGRFECKNETDEVIIVSGRIGRFEKSLYDRGVKL